MVVLRRRKRWFPPKGVRLFDGRKAHIPMGVYLNNATAYSLYEKETKKPYFVDKTQILEQLLVMTNRQKNTIAK